MSERTAGTTSKPKSFWRHQVPSIIMVFAFVSFMNARSAWTAGFAGAAVLAFMIWQVRTARKQMAGAGRVLFSQGRLRAIGPTRLIGLHALAAVAFALLGFVMFFLPEGWSIYGRLMMALVCWSIVGGWWAAINSSLYPIGLVIFTAGFVAAGICGLLEAINVYQAGEEDFLLTAVKWSVFSLVLLAGGVPGLFALLSGRGRTQIYEDGIVGPYGFVPWRGAEAVQLQELSNGTFLEVQAYHGWILRISVPPNLHETVAEFVADQSDTNDAPAHVTEIPATEESASPDAIQS